MTISTLMTSAAGRPWPPHRQRPVRDDPSRRAVILVVWAAPTRRQSPRLPGVPPGISFASPGDPLPELHFHARSSALRGTAHRPGNRGADRRRGTGSHGHPHGLPVRPRSPDHGPEAARHLGRPPALSGGPPLTSGCQAVCRERWGPPPSAADLRRSAGNRRLRQRRPPRCGAAARPEL